MSPNGTEPRGTRTYLTEGPGTEPWIGRGDTITISKHEFVILQLTEE